MIAVINCPNCDSTYKKIIFNVPDRHYGNKGCFSYSECINCGLIYLDPMPTDSELMTFYPEETYYSYNVDLLKSDPTWKELLRKVLFLGYKTKDPSFPRPGRMLDIGCGSGWFIYGMQKKGWEVKGVEPSKVGVELGRRIANLDIHNGDLLSGKYPSEYFDYIRSNHSFEHISNPNEVLREIYRILKPGGRVFIGVPNINSFNGKVFGQYWYYLGAPVHTFNYSNKTLPALISKHNFRNIKVRYNSNYNGILGSIQIIINKGSGRLSHDGMVINFFPLKILAGFTSKVLNILRLGDCIEVTFEK